MNALAAAGAPVDGPRFDGCVVVVTGGARGLGLALTRAFVAAGARVAVAGRSEESLRRVEADFDGRVRGFVCDVADEAALAGFAQRVEVELGAPDVLVNNAGINPWYQRPEDTALEQWREVLRVNLDAPFHGCQLFGRRMLERGSGAIVNISSVAAYSGLPRTAAYCAAKGGLEALTRSLAVDWAKRGVRVNCVAPGYFSTDLTEGLRDNERLSAMVLGHTPMGRYGRPDELVGACLFLASPAASYITGQSLLVDGGWRAW
jgi:gluconate 5-dehydrogenase